MVALALALASCAPDPRPTASSRPEPTAPGVPAQPEFHPEGTAEDNLAIFTEVTEAVAASDQRASGRAYVDALVDAGFDKSAMQVTQDSSTVGNAAETLQFSVRWGEEDCLIGQVGPSTGDPVTVVVDQLAEGRCLIGNTRPIDW